MSRRELSIEVSDAGLSVSAVLERPPNASWLLVLAHGAGAGMHHPFLAYLVERLSERRLATLRYRFPYRQRGQRRPDRAALLEATVRAVIEKACHTVSDLPLLAGGKSMGGRMTSRAAAAKPLPGVRGLVFFGFPLHPPGRQSIERADHLDRVDLPMLFLQGDRDRLADLSLLRPVCRRIGNRASLVVFEGADHGFHVPKRSGRTDAALVDELAVEAASWAAQLRP